MVKITNGVNVFEVTRGAFVGIYSHQGYRILKDDAEEKSSEEIVKPEKTDDEKFIDDILEKPISQWNKEEVKRFAALKEIDISGTKNASEAKSIIQGFIEDDLK